MWKNRDEYIKQDDYGRWINIEFPPDSYTQFPNNTGYRNTNTEMLFYQYAVQYYDLRIEYQGVEYLAIVDDDGAYYEMITDVFPTANDLIKSFTFPDGKRLIELVQSAKLISIDIL